jgi:outer membrane protein TolC
MREAIHHSPALSAARHDAQAAREGVAETKGSLLPFLSARASTYEVNGTPTTPFSALRVFDPGNPRGNAHWGPVGIESIGVTYPLIQGGGILGLFNDPPQIAAARAMVDEKLAGILLVEQKVVFDTVTDYLYAASYHEEQHLTSSVLELSEQRLEIIKYQTELGLQLPQDVELAVAQVTAAQRAAASAKLNADGSVAALTAEIDHQGADLAVDTALPPIPPLPPLREFLAHVMPSHPALRIQQGQVEIAQQQVRIDKAALFPSVKLNLDLAGAQDLEHIRGGTLSNFLSFIQVDLPIFDFGRRRAAIRASKEKAASAMDSLNALELELRNSIALTYREINDTDQQIATLQTYVLKARNEAALADARRSEGIIDQLTWTEAQLQVPVAQIALCQAQLLMQLKYAELRNLSGGIWHWLDNPMQPPMSSTSTQLQKESDKHAAKVVSTTLVQAGTDAK